MSCKTELSKINLVLSCLVYIDLHSLLSQVFRFALVSSSGDSIHMFYDLVPVVETMEDCEQSKFGIWGDVHVFT